MSEWVYEELRRRIVEGVYAGGTRLKEQDVAAELGVSRTPVRGALVRLDADGLVELVPNRGAYVIDWNRSRLTDALELHTVIAAWGAGQAALRRTEEHLEQLRAICADMEVFATMESARAVQTLAELDDAFHETVSDASGNTLLNGLRRRLAGIPMQDNFFAIYKSDERRRAITDHLEILQLVEKQDSEGAHARMFDHVKRGWEFLLQHAEVD